MSFLAERFREEVAKSKDYATKVEKEFAVGYPTGFLTFDFLNGTIVHVQDPTPEKCYSYYSIGISDGSMVMAIGRSGSGKTTLVVQMAANIIRPFKTSSIFYDDIEGGISDTRLQALTGFDSDEIHSRILIRNTAVTAESFYERIKLVHDIKMENRADYLYDTGVHDIRGERIYKLEPTVYILDSLAMLTPDKYANEDELSGQMSATAAAKQNAMIFKRIIPMLKSANIILFVINHVNQKVDANPMQPTKNQVSYLKKGETLPGGNTPIYVSNVLLRVDNISKLKETEGLGVAGEVVEISLVKSRNNSAGRSVRLIFDRTTGFDSILSLYYFMKERGKIKGAGAYLYVTDYSDYKFSQKNLKNMLYNNADFRQIFLQECQLALQEFLQESTCKSYSDNGITDDLLKMISGSTM